MNKNKIFREKDASHGCQADVKTTKQMTAMEYSVEYLALTREQDGDEYNERRTMRHRNFFCERKSEFGEAVKIPFSNRCSVALNHRNMCGQILLDGSAFSKTTKQKYLFPCHLHRRFSYPQ